MKLSILVIATRLCLVIGRTPLSVRVGGLIDSDDQQLDTALRSSVSYVNQDQNLLNQTRIDTDIQFTAGDQFNIHISACQEVSYSVLTLLSSCGRYDSVVSSVTKHTNIPHLSMEVVSLTEASTFSLYLAPSKEDIQLAVTDILIQLGTPTVGLVSHSLSGFLNIQSMVEGLQMSGIEVMIADLTSKDIRPDLVRIRIQSVDVIVVDVGTSLVEIFVEQAMQSGILHSQSTIIFTSLDFGSINLEVARLTGAILIGLSLLNWQTLEEKNMSEDLKLLVEQDYRAALMFDAVRLFGKTVEEFSESRDPVNPRVNCEDTEKIYQEGEALMAVYKNITVMGITGKIKFGKMMHREEMKLFLVGLEDSGMVKTLGSWERNQAGTKMDVSLGQVVINKRNLKKFKKILKIGSVLSSFLMMNEHSKTLKGNQRYFGFHKDLLDFLSAQLHFEYELVVEEEPTQFSKGFLDPATEKWTGLIGKLINDDVDVALGDLTMTSQRSSVLDFSVPYMTSLLVAVVKKPSSSVSHPSLSILLSPFSGSMWFSLLVALLVASLLLPLIARISPYERSFTQKDNTTITVQNSSWLIFSGLFLQSVNIPLKAVSTRAFCCCCWMLTLLILLLYSSSLHRLLSLPVEEQTLEQLLEEESSRLGVVTNGSTQHLLQQSKSPLLQSLWSKVDPSLPIPSLQAGVFQMMSSSKLVLLMESIQADLLPTSTACSLITIASFGPRYYGLGFRRGSHLTQIFNSVLLHMEESGRMEQLLNRWTSKKQCPEPHNTSAISLPFYGCLLFVVTSGLLAIFLCLLELMVYCRTNTTSSLTVGGVLARELREILSRKKTEKSPVVRSPIYLTNGTASQSKLVYSPEESVTNKLLSHKLEEERMENSRL